MRADYQALVEAPCPRLPCLLGIRIEQQFLIGIDYLFADMRLPVPQTPFARKVVEQLRDYFTDPEYCFDLPLRMQGTPFQRRVWSAMRSIPAGETRTYGILADGLNSSPRAVGNACRANPLPVIVPCHRVVSVSGLGGYGGRTSGRNISIKRWLLDHEAC